MHTLLEILKRAGGWNPSLYLKIENAPYMALVIEATGEYSVEAWVAPALVAADKSYMVSYSGGDTLRNFTLGQTNQNYDFLMRSSASDLNGMPQ